MTGDEASHPSGESWAADPAAGDAADDFDALATELDVERRRYHEIFDELPDLHLVTDTDGVIRELNRTARSALPSATEGRPLVLCVAPADRAAFHRFLNRRDGTDGDHPPTLTFLGCSGEVRLWMRCGDVGAGQLLWTLRDVTAAEAAERRLVEVAERDRLLAEQFRVLDELRSSFFLAVTHDLRAPLAAIAGLAGLLADADLRADDRESVVAQIRYSADRVVDLFSGLLDLERLERGEFSPRRTTIEMGEELEAIVRDVEFGDHVLVFDIEPVQVESDPLLLGEVVVNLLRNAVQHTPPGTHVWLRCRREPDGVVLAVEDDGPGVSVAVAPVAFEPFSRDRRPGRTDGLGVGLTIVRRFTELLGGHVHLESRAGGGASFQVLLPEE